MKFIELAKIGDRITYRPNFGAGVPTEGIITKVEKSVKNGRAGGDLDNGHWFYAEQVVTIQSSDGSIWLRSEYSDDYCMVSLPIGK